MEFVFFFFKQKTAYEMRISDWSSDVCSSDPDVGTIAMQYTHVAGAKGCGMPSAVQPLAMILDRHRIDGIGVKRRDHRFLAHIAELRDLGAQIGRASCRARVCQYV